MLETLFQHYGAQHWWPAQSRLEVILGAYLVQHTAWANAERAISNLRRARALKLEVLRRMPQKRLEELLRPAGHFRQKAAYLREFVDFVAVEHGGSLPRLFSLPTTVLRAQLLSLKGVGPETADAILLYAGGREVFVADAYARRVAQRHGFPWVDYQQVSSGFQAAVQELAPINWHNRDPRHAPSRMSRQRRTEIARIYSEAHAVLVRVGSDFCRTIPRCEECPLWGYLSGGK